MFFQIVILGVRAGFILPPAGRLLNDDEFLYEKNKEAQGLERG
jgi:hypothetical protein